MEFSAEQLEIIKVALRRGLICAAYAMITDDVQSHKAAVIHKGHIESALGMIEEMERRDAID